MPAPAVAEGDSQLIETARRVLPGGGFGNVSPRDHHRRRPGRTRLGRERQRVRRLSAGLGPDDRRPCASRGRRGGAGSWPPRARRSSPTTSYGIRLAAEIVDAVACAEKVRFVSTGSEADAYAMRLARAYTNRDKILKFEGGYHGMSDYGLMSLAPKRAGNFPQPIPDSAGIPKSLRDEMLVAPFNDLETVASLDARAQGRAGRHHRRALPAPDPAQARLPRRPAQAHRRRTAWC